MSSEIISVLEYIEKEKGISRETMIPVISNAIKSAAEKAINVGQELKIEINPKTGVLKAWALLEVVDSLSDPKSQIHIEKARLMHRDIQVGDIFEQEISPAHLGRIAAQTARQGIMQKLRDFEKERIYEDFKDQVGDIVSGTVRRHERGDLIIELGKAEAVLSNRERIPGEDYSSGERIRCFLLSIDNTSRGPELILSRSNVKFVRRLFELEVTEIADGTVTIESIAREAGYRTKVCVHSNDPKVDPVGACVGTRGARVKTIVRELGGEKIDIINYHPDPIKMLEEALKPAIPKNVRVDEQSRRIHFELAEKDLSVAIGRRGQNARLTSKLIGWKLDINEEKKSSVGFDQRVRKAVAGLHQIPGIEDALAERLVAVGFTSPDAFEGVTVADLTELQFTEEEAESILKKVADFLESSFLPSN